MKRRTFLLQSGAGLATAALPALAEGQNSKQESQNAGTQKGIAPGAKPAGVKTAGAHGAIVHPGILQTRSDLEFMKARIKAGDEPWKSAWDHWMTERTSSLDFKPKPFVHVIRGASGAGERGGGELSASASAVASHVLQWYVTGNEANAKKAVEIFDAWSGTLADFFENDAQLLAGWTGGDFCNAAEILRATYPGWQADSILRFKKMMLTVYTPLIRGFYPGANGNWDAAMMFTLLAIGVFCEKRDLMEEVYHHYRFSELNGGITKYVYPSGQCEETTRDQGHVQAGLGYFARTALVAWNQGVDLFAEADNRLALGYEYTSRFMVGEEVPYYGKISTQGRGRFSDVYEIILQHYRYEKHIHMPYTEQASARAIERSHSVVTAFRGERGKAPATLAPPPAPSAIAATAGAQLKATGVVPEWAITVAAGKSIQEALDKVRANGGGAVSLGAGVHTLPATLRIPSGVTIVGTGRDCELFLDPTKMQFEAAMVNADMDLHDVVLRDFVIEGAQTPQTSADPNTDVQRRRPLHGPIRSGIVFQSDGNVVMSNLRLEQITVRNCSYSAVEIFGASGVNIVACDFSASGGVVPPGSGLNHNLKLNHVSKVTINGTRMSGSMWGCGVAVAFGKDVSMHNCEFSRNQLDGVRIAESSQVTVEACLIEGNNGQAIAQQTWMNANAGVAIKNNIVRNNGS